MSKINVFASTVERINYASSKTVCFNTLTLSDLNNVLLQSLKLRVLISKLTENAVAEQF